MCNAHPPRAPLYVLELTGHPWSRAMMDPLLNANRLCAAARRAGVGFSATEIAAPRTLYDTIVGAGEELHPEVGPPIRKGGRSKQSLARKLLRKFRAKHVQRALHSHLLQTFTQAKQSLL